MPEKRRPSTPFTRLAAGAERIGAPPDFHTFAETAQLPITEAGDPKLNKPLQLGLEQALSRLGIPNDARGMWELQRSLGINTPLRIRNLTTSSPRDFLWPRSASQTAQLAQGLDSRLGQTAISDGPEASNVTQELIDRLLQLFYPKGPK